METSMCLDPVDVASARVLIVDDTPDARSLLRLRFQTHGQHTIVGEAADGFGAIAQARALQPDLIVLDMELPGMGGLEVIPLIRQAAPDARLIVHTVFHPGTLEQRAIAAGADRYVMKGGSMREFMAVVESVLHAG